MSRAATFALLALALAIPTLAGAQPVKVTVLAVESVEDFRHWLGKPVDAARVETGIPTFFVHSA